LAKTTFFSPGNKQPTRALREGAPGAGPFLFLVIAMHEMTDFFQKEAQECKTPRGWGDPEKRPRILAAVSTALGTVIAAERQS